MVQASSQPKSFIVFTKETVHVANKMAPFKAFG